MELDYPYSNHMVLQRNKDIILSGTSKEKEVRMTFLDKEYKVPVNDGRWQVSFKTEKTGGPYRMVLTDDRDTLILDDVLVGDVYLAAGQSNMELEMRESKEKKLPSYHPNVRIMTVPKYIYPFEDDNQRWKSLNEETVLSFSAVASFFSYYLDEDIPIGIISNNKGGTSASCWIEEEVLKGNDVLKENVYDPYYDDLSSLDIQKEETDKYYSVFNNYQKELKDYINTQPDMTLSQIKNKEKAFKVLRSRLYDLKMQEQYKEIADQRKSMVGTGDRSERIRTYNFPQGRVSDHRIGLTLYKLDNFLDGDLDEIIDGLITSDQAEKMKAF